MNNVIRTTLTIMLLLLTAVGMAATTTEPRQSLTSQGKDIVRGSVGDGAVYSELDALETTGTRSKNSARSAQQKLGTGSGQSQAGDPNFWFYDVDVDLFSDFDHDGYYFGIDLWFDADTTYAVADVYAVLYLSYEYGPWNEYAVTDDFTLFGSIATDDYVVETELISGYLTGNYDILIELFDAYDDTYLTSIGPDEMSTLSILPLEDSTLDVAPTGPTQVVVNSGGGGGSLSFLLLFGLLAVRMTLRPQADRSSK